MSRSDHIHYGFSVKFMNTCAGLRAAVRPVFVIYII